MHLTSVLDISNAYAASKTLRLLTDVPCSLETFIISLQSAFTFGLVRSSANQLRKATSKDTSLTVQFPDQLSWLADHGYTREDTRQIRYVVEIFYHLEPVFMILLALASRVIKPGDTEIGSGSIAIGSCMEDIVRSGPIQHLDERAYKKCLDPVFERYGFPAHLFFRSLAVWPDFFENIWGHIERSLESKEYNLCSSGLHSNANALATRIPISEYSTELQDECQNDSIKNILRMSGDVTLIAGALRRVFMRTEVAARNKRAVGMS